MGRSRLPPAPAMYPPISWMRATGESSWPRISASTACSSDPTSDPTRSLRTCSRVGVGTRGLLGDDAVPHPDLSAWLDRLDLGHRELVAQLDDPRRTDLLVQLAQDLAGHRVHDRNAVPAQAHHGAIPDTIGVGEV